MGIWFKKGQYAKAFTAAVASKGDLQHGYTATNWREAAIEQIERLIKQRGGFKNENISLKDERSTLKMLRQLEILPIHSKNEQIKQLVELLNLLKEDKNTRLEIEKKIEHIKWWLESGSEFEKLVTAIETFIKDPDQVKRNNDITKTRDPSSPDNNALAVTKPNPFGLVFEPAPLTTPPPQPLSNVQSLPLVPQIDQMGTTMPWAAALNPYYAADRAERHQLTQTIEQVFYTLGATIINQSPTLLKKYHNIQSVSRNVLLTK